MAEHGRFESGRDVDAFDLLVLTLIEEIRPTIVLSDVELEGARESVSNTLRRKDEAGRDKFRGSDGEFAVERVAAYMRDVIEHRAVDQRKMRGRFVSADMELEGGATLHDTLLSHDVSALDVELDEEERAMRDADEAVERWISALGSETDEFILDARKRRPSATQLHPLDFESIADAIRFAFGATRELAPDAVRQRSSRLQRRMRKELGDDVVDEVMAPRKGRGRKG